ncbi:MAG: CHRD domain-containing protein, partial [Gaiellaceae bacterium]
MRKLFAVLVAALATFAVAGLAPAGENANFRAHLTGDDEVPPNASAGQGQAIFHLSGDGTELDYKLIAANIENVVASHIHLGAEGVNGPVVAFL